MEEIAGGTVIAAVVVASAGSAGVLVGTALTGCGSSAAVAGTAATAATVGTCAVGGYIGATSVSDAGEVLTGHNVIRDDLIKPLAGESAESVYEGSKMISTLAGLGINEWVAVNPAYLPTSKSGASSQAEEVGGEKDASVNSTLSNTLTDAQKSRLNALNNTINDHLTEEDFSGTLRDLQGNPVPNGQGGYFNHLGEMKDSYKSLQKIKNALEGSLRNPNLLSNDRALLQGRVG